MKSVRTISPKKYSGATMYLTNLPVELKNASVPLRNFTMLEPFKKRSLYSGLMALSYSVAVEGRGG